jgi:hypothetical protein
VWKTGSAREWLWLSGKMRETDLGKYQEPV